VPRGTWTLSTPDAQRDSGTPNIADPEGQAHIEEHLDGVELLILDNLSTLCVA
jgi:putative DNA primase/helicase